MERVTTELDPFILAFGALGVLLLVIVLVVLNKLIASNNKLLMNQKNQNELLLTISNVLSSKSEAESLQIKQKIKVGDSSPEQTSK